ncbi:predicted protein [Sclerotinia sclerotiorum 1980 UF-70]|uniref:Uncharacterized protein n=1 Tax=Sclerotinia sclerotiorum (strain ATCC 18683 / 1980 / Ss-1) TaxID=665079 RepID=A7F135_SCLS1|nr:predicted protein [Sclerotinia sclerotiorum 1980 UF-70]EDN95427.1 predicted protein [Sclerotinia sclerotiorum 1980 UF-70]
MGRRGGQARKKVNAMLSHHATSRLTRIKRVCSKFLSE